MLNKPLKVYLPILIIIVTAIALRFYNYFNIPFTHDELSALTRLNFNSLHNVLEFGVAKTDTHPAGVQIFLYLLTQLFGSGTAVVKLPFIIAGVWSVWLIYIITKKWYGYTPAILASAIFASLQYTVENSITARPYSLGLFFVLMAFYFWQQFHYKHTKLFLNLAGYIVFSVFAAYTHYFALLVCILIWLYGLFILTPPKTKPYIISGVIMLLAGLPHLPITIEQISAGGIGGWIGPFKWHYPAIYAAIVMQQSWFLLIVYMLIFLIAFNWRNKTGVDISKIIMAGIFADTFFIGALYSHFVNNVMHEKSLYFAFPFLLIFFVSFTRELHRKWQLVLAIIILACNTTSLIFERRHFNLFYKNAYQQTYLAATLWPKNYNIDNNTTIVLFANPAKTKLLGNTSHIFFFEPDTDAGSFYNFIKQQNTNYIFFGAAQPYNPAFKTIVNLFYQNTIKQAYTVGAEAFIASKLPTSTSLDNLLNNQNPKIICKKNTINNLIEYHFDTIYTSSLTKCKYCTINYMAKIVCSNNLTQAKMVVLINNAANKPQVIEYPLAGFNSIDTTFTAVYAVNLADISFRNTNFIGCKIVIPATEQTKILDTRFFITPANPVIYGNVKKIPRNLNFDGF